MKKLRILRNAWWGFVICLIFLSCNNIFDSGDFKEQLDRDIAYARSSPYEIRVECDDWAGSLISLSLLSQKVTDVFNVEFKLGSGVQFAGWKAYQKSLDGTFSELNSDYIDFISYNKESNDGIYKASVKLIKGVEGIVIKPYCFRLPKVVEITPKFESAGCDQDSPIQIKFNKAVDLESFGDFSCIQIYSENGSLDDYFGTPFLSEDKEILSIPAKSDMHILTPDTEKKLEVSVKVDFKNVTDVDGLPIVQPEPHMYRIKESYGNQEKVKVLVKSASSFGSFLSDGYKECTVGYSFDLQFTLKKSEYEFRGLEAVSTDDNSESRDNAVSFEILPESDQEAGIYKIRVSIVKSFDDILIQPKCVLLPKVTEITPKFESSGCDQNNAIKITFNKPVDTASFGDFECISIFSARGNHLDCFDKPEFSADKTVLYIKTKADKLILTPDSGQVLDITVKTDFSGVKDVDGVEIAAAESYTYRINDSFTNQKKAKLTVKTVEGTGSFLSDGEKWCTVGYSVDLQFTVKKSEYEFRGLEAVSSSDSSIKYTDAVSFEELERNSETGVYKIRVKVLEQKDDIVIQPKCVLLPKVLKITPEFVSTGYDQDTPISILFNKPVDTESFGDFSCIEIYSSEESLTGYFGSPEFSDDRTSIYIRPYSDLHILAPDSDKKLDISVRLDFSKVKDQDGIALTQLEPHTYRIKDTYGNQQKVTFNVRTIDGMGTFLSDGAKACTLGYSVDLQFNVNKSKYNFVKLEAVSSDNTSVSRSSAVNIDTISRDSENGIYKIRVTVLDNYSDILIRPVCTEKFIVKSVLPENKDSGVPRDSAILITFSDKVDPASIEGKIKITDSNSSDLLSHYAEPVLINNDTTVKYSPRRDSPVITSGTAMINVNVDDGVRSANGEVLEGFDGYKFKMNSSFDSEPPLFVDFRVSKTKEGLGLKKGESQKLIGESNEYEETEDFHIKDFVWIYCKAEDKGSGAYYLTANGKKIPLTYASATDDMSANFVSTAENIYEIGPFMAEFSSDDYADGKIDVEFEIYDYCDNKCLDKKVYSFIRDTEVTAQTNLVVYNKLREPDFILLREPGTQDYENLYYEYDEFMEAYKTFYVKGMKNDIWSVGSTELSQANIVVKCGSYTAKFVAYDDMSKEFVFKFDKIDNSIDSDLKIEVVIYDSVGNECVHCRSIPNGTDASAYTISYGTIYPYPEKTSGKDSKINSFEYRIFYEAMWDNESIQKFKAARHGLEWYSSDSYGKSELTVDDHFSIEEAITELNDWLESEGEEKRFQINRKYICDINEWSRYYTYGWFNRWVTYADGSRKQIFDTYRQDSSARYFFNSKINGIDESSHFYTKTGINTSLNFFNGKITIYYVPVYTYSDGNIYGVPVKKSINYAQNASSTEDFELSFNVKNPVDAGINTGKCKVEIKNIKVSNLQGENVIDDFNISYFSKESTSTKYYDEPVIYFNSALSTGQKCELGVKAVNKNDESIVIIKTISDIPLVVKDNYSPSVYAITDKDSFSRAEFSLYDDNSYDVMKLPIIYDEFSSSITKYYSYFTDICLDTQNMFGVNSSDYAYTSKVNFKYYWLKKDSSWDNKAVPELEENVILENAVKSGESYFTFSKPNSTQYSNTYTLEAYTESCDMNSDNLKLFVPVDGLVDGEYLLCVKISDPSGNYALKPFLYHSIKTYSKTPDWYTNSNGNIFVKLAETDSGGRNTWVAVLERYDSSTNKWKYFASENISTPTSYTSFNSPLTSGSYYRLWVVGSYEYHWEDSAYSYPDRYYVYVDKKNNYCYSKPVIFYFYTGTQTTPGYNMIEGVAGLSILGSGSLAQTYYCEGEGYGSDYDKWERFGKPLSSKYFSTSITNYTGYEDVPDGCSYVVGVYFRNCTSSAAKEQKIFSNVHKK